MFEPIFMQLGSLGTAAAVLPVVLGFALLAAGVVAGAGEGGW